MTTDIRSKEYWNPRFAIERVRGTCIALLLALVENGNTVVDERETDGVLNQARVSGVGLESRLVMVL